MRGSGGCRKRVGAAVVQRRVPEAAHPAQPCTQQRGQRARSGALHAMGCRMLMFHAC
jgi:hypothetical protein